MESTIDSLSAAYDAFILAAVGVIDAQDATDGQQTPETAAALQAFKERYELFASSCDSTEDHFKSLQRSLLCEHIAAEMVPPPTPEDVGTVLAEAAPEAKAVEEGGQ